ncbi:hypothetical protein VVD49_17160 [Uliginosibacterium sp. H3]|uniref:Uncharacterized protein n=1 Tax=Uliginosibacterium silvisoli TaxID=3114758 RepID=A0ABU6K8U2_9RHOO|nr:hypothetical protein [Uliginosibacterium sp. H3]
MRGRNILTAFLALAMFGFHAAPLQARDASKRSPQELFEALVQRFSGVLLASPTRSSPAPDTAVVLLEGKALPLGSRLQSTTSLRVLTQEQLVAEQRAVFIIVTQVGAQGPDILIDYEIPTNASSGTLRVQDQDEKLVFKSEDSYRSGSGSRATYARLYGGITCRDDTEMAFRYNFYALSRESGRCARPTFPESSSPFEW